MSRSVARGDDCDFTSCKGDRVHPRSTNSAEGGPQQDLRSRESNSNNSNSNLASGRADERGLQATGTDTMLNIPNAQRLLSGITLSRSIARGDECDSTRCKGDLGFPEGATPGEGGPQVELRSRESNPAVQTRIYPPRGLTSGHCRLQRRPRLPRGRTPWRRGTAAG